MSTEPRLPKPREGIRSVRAYRTQQEPAGVHLQSNEWPEPHALSHFFTPAELDAIVLNRYPDANATPLRTLLARQWSVSSDQLIVGNGSNEVILHTLLVFGGGGRTVLIFTPTYPIYGRLAAVTGTRIAAEEIGLPYEIDPARVLRAMTTHQPNLVVFCRPNNPTGNVVHEEAVLAAAEADSECLVLIDEAYAEFARVTMLPRLATHSNIVIAKTFSKIHAVAGVRLGVLIAHPKIIDTLDAARLPYNVGTLTQAIGAKVAERGDISDRVDLIARERAGVERGLRAHDELDVFPSLANFVLFRDRLRRAADLHAAILEHGVLVRDVSMWPGAAECLRATIGTPTENRHLLDAIDKALAARARA